MNNSEYVWEILEFFHRQLGGEIWIHGHRYSKAGAHDYIMAMDEELVPVHFMLEGQTVVWLLVCAANGIDNLVDSFGTPSLTEDVSARWTATQLNTLFDDWCDYVERI